MSELESHETCQCGCAQPPGLLLSQGQTGRDGRGRLREHAGGAALPGVREELAHKLALALHRLGVRHAWGVTGREIVPMRSALLESVGTGRHIRTFHARHENGAGFAAVGGWMQSGRPMAIYVTTGPGLTNVLTSLESARASGAKLVLLSPLTPAIESGRLGIQDTGHAGYGNAGLYAPGRLFDAVVRLESPAQLPGLVGLIAAGFAGHGAFMAHIAIPTTQQTVRTRITPVVPGHRRPAPAPSDALADDIVDLLAAEPFAVWVGWGARRHAAAIRRLLDLTGAPVMTSPRGLGVADRHRQFIGVTGNGGHESVVEELTRHCPQRTLVLGTGVGEATSGWDPALVPPRGFIHVDLDPGVFAKAYPQAPTLGVQADIGEALAAILQRSARLVRRPGPRRRPGSPWVTVAGHMQRPIHPAALMAALQRVVVDRTDMPVLADASSAMFWGAHHLSFDEPGRWFIEGRWGSMGFAGAAVVGAAAARGGGAVAICGDGAMHMQDEIATAVQYGLYAIWVVLNDSGLGIVRNGMRLNGRTVHDADYPATDFAALARSKGAHGLRVTHEQQLDTALGAAVLAGGPFVVDVVIDPEAIAPIGSRAKR